MKFRILIVFTLLVSLFAGCGIQIKPLPSVLAKIEADKLKNTKDPKLVYRFFDEDFVAGGYEWHYPDESEVFIAEESGKNGEVSLQMNLVHDDYSGGAVELYNLSYDLIPYYRAGAIEFWLKGSLGGEKCYALIFDSELGDGYKTAVKVPLNDYADITTDWTHFSIPLADFGKRGKYWDEKKKVEVPRRFEWDKITGFEITIEKGDNPKFTIWIDDIFVLRDVFEPVEDVEEIYWDEMEEVLPLPPVASKPKVEDVHSIFKDVFEGNAFTHCYGGKSAHKIQPTENIEKNAGVFAIYMDNTDYAGTNINLGQSLDLKELRNSKAGIGFWAKFGENVSSVFVGVLDDESDGHMVQTNLILSDYAKLSTEWQYFMIPLKDFGNQGNWWDEMKKAEIPAEIQWDKIIEICFNSDKYGNRLEDGAAVSIYLDDITIIKEVPGYVDPDEYWNAFKSDAEDLTIFDFEEPKDAVWEAISGEESELHAKVIDQEDRSLREKFGLKMLEIEYSNGDWCYSGYPFAKNSASAEIRDWTKYWAIEFDCFTEKDEEIVKVQLADAGKEAFDAKVKCVKGWNKILLPLKKFRKYPYYQVADAVLNNKLDLEAVTSMSFWPTAAGTMGKLRIDNVKLTNRKK